MKTIHVQEVDFNGYRELYSCGAGKLTEQAIKLVKDSKKIVIQIEWLNKSKAVKEAEKIILENGYHKDKGLIENDILNTVSEVYIYEK